MWISTPDLDRPPDPGDRRGGVPRFGEPKPPKVAARSPSRVAVDALRRIGSATRRPHGAGAGLRGVRPCFQHPPGNGAHGPQRPSLVQGGAGRLRITDLVRVDHLRHAAATMLLQAEVHPKVVSERLGHSTITLTLDTYSHVVPGLDADAAARLEWVMQGNGAG